MKLRVEEWATTDGAQQAQIVTRILKDEHADVNAHA